MLDRQRRADPEARARLLSSVAPRRGPFVESGGWWGLLHDGCLQREAISLELAVRKTRNGGQPERARSPPAASIFARHSGRQALSALRRARTRGYFHAANILAAAVYAGRLRRRIGVRRRAIILVPTDKALSGPTATRSAPCCSRVANGAPHRIRDHVHLGHGQDSFAQIERLERPRTLTADEDHWSRRAVCRLLPCWTSRRALASPSASDHSRSIPR